MAYFIHLKQRNVKTQASKSDTKCLHLIVPTQQSQKQTVKLLEFRVADQEFFPINKIKRLVTA